MAKVLGVFMAASAVLVTSTGSALEPPEKCEVLKLKAAGKYDQCRLKAEAKAVQRGESVDHGNCNDKFNTLWDRAEEKGEGLCPTSGDKDDARAFFAAHTDFTAGSLKGGGSFFICGFPATGQTDSYATADDGDIEAGATLSYTVHGDGTVTDDNTGLMWELKDSGGLSSGGRTHSWTGALSWVDLLNYTCDDDASYTACTTDADCPAYSGVCGLASHQDWRLPNIKELESIVNFSRTVPAITVSVFGDTSGCGVLGLCTQAAPYWSSTTAAVPPGNGAWALDFATGAASMALKTTGTYYARAVRGGS